jgi:hypothetical protein
MRRFFSPSVPLPKPFAFDGSFLIAFETKRSGVGIPADYTLLWLKLL